MIRHEIHRLWPVDLNPLMEKFTAQFNILKMSLMINCILIGLILIKCVIKFRSKIKYIRSSERRKLKPLYM